MGIDFDENGRNEEYEADVTESTGEINDHGKPAPRAPVVVPAATVIHGNVNDLLAGIMGKSTAAAQPQTVAEALEVSQDAYMDEVEKRLEIASYYRAALANPMFDNDTEAARTVQHEFSGFIRERLGVLLSIGEAKKTESTFSDTQVEVLRLLGDLTPNHVTALKMVASKLLGEGSPEAPVVRQASAPPAVRQAPAPAAPRRAPSPMSAPVPAQVPQQSVQATPERPRGPGRPPGAKNKPKDLTQMVQAVRRHPDGSEEPLFDKEGNPRMVPIRRLQRPSGALPFPNEAQMSQVTAIQAGDRVAKLEQNPEVQAAFKGLQHPV